MRAAVLLLAVLLLAAALPACAAAKAPAATVRIAVPYTRAVRQFASNSYKLWLEEQTGLDIEFVEIDVDNTEEYLRMAFASGNSTLDAIFLPRDGAEWLTTAALQEFGAQGYLLPLEAHIDAAGENARALFEDFEDYDLRRAVTAPDGHIYYLPNVRMTDRPRSAQTLWINVGWLKRLELEVPRTTGELQAVLQAFATRDPNRNGQADELPVVGSMGDPALRATGFLMGSFVYNDISSAHMLVQSGQVAYAPAADGWRQGLAYLAGLYGQGLLPALNFTFTPEQVVQLANDPRDLVGCFTAGSITDVLFQGSPEVISRFIHVAPLASPAGKGLAAVQPPSPRPGGCVTAACKDPAAVFRLMDLMLGQEASRIAWYGEEGVDWQLASHGMISVYGSAATIQVLNSLNGKVQNKTLAGLGPGALAAADADGVTWNGFEVDQEYVDARASLTYRNHYPDEYLTALLFPPEEDAGLQAIRAAVEQYTDEMMQAFITGQADLEDDAAWRQYLARLDALGLPRLVAAAQASYDRQREETEHG